MKILVISDNHSNESIVDEILKKEKFDLAIHTGDSEKSEKWLSARFDYYVAGNNDHFDNPKELTVDLQGIKTLILHGHTRGIYVNTQYLPIVEILKNNQYDLIIHGHSHIYRNEIIKQTKILCSGSVSWSRGPEGNGYLTFKIVDQKISDVKFIKI